MCTALVPSLFAMQSKLTKSEGLANSDGRELIEEDDSKEALRNDAARTSREGHPSAAVPQSLVLSQHSGSALHALTILLIMRTA